MLPRGQKWWQHGDDDDDDDEIAFCNHSNLIQIICTQLHSFKYSQLILIIFKNLIQVNVSYFVVNILRTNILIKLLIIIIQRLHYSFESLSILFIASVQFANIFHILNVPTIMGQWSKWYFWSLSLLFFFEVPEFKATSIT